MKVSKLLSVLFLSQVLFFASCKKCYECEEYEYCADCTYTCTPSGGGSSVGCFGTSIERDKFVSDMKTENPSCTVVCTVSDNLLPGNQEEICDTKKEAEDSAGDLEVQGYKCVEE